MTHRRDFIKKSALGTAGLSLGAMAMSAKSYASIKGANDRFRIAVCGVNGRGKSHISGFSKLENVEIAYLVDPDSAVLEERVSQLGAREEGISQKVKGLGDVRKVLDMKDIDAISCATPNHWHFSNGDLVSTGKEALLCRKARQPRYL
jgi:predicted ABC-type ATPase